MTKVRIALLSDTHGAIDSRVQEVVAGCDLAVHGGDIGRASILAELQPRLGRVLAVFGNNDVARKWPEQDRQLLVHLPEWIEQPLPGGKLAVIHGHQVPARDRHRLLRARFPEVRAIVYGHSHRLVEDLQPAPWVLNPGAAGRARTHGGPSCLVLVATAGDWHLETYRFPLTLLNRRLRYTHLHDKTQSHIGQTAQDAATAGRTRDR
ncbi:metallophosphoesterase family protein [Thiorhodococcus mannitoliphagus]|uniref:Metallophosphoesterase family protein n=1 Tax=Thiorhodococcus mannitoliphagus TaxID=329406 RepID=A0A6P1E034_9GAMM|nr:metallophosphoesterase family protein [Thiorhodococcus mannitoliphagus]NEX21344.1 metallophosphoesterase family protein [Thiorhodococcus mannitoliphagus]